MVEWREEQRVKARLSPRTSALDPPAAGGFAADAERYLDAVRAMPSIRDRRQHIEEWIAIFSDRPRASISSSEIRAQRDRWLTIGPRRRFTQVDGVWKWRPVAEPLAPGSVNRRLRALENLWTVLDGPQAPNPVRDVPECEEPAALPRGSSFSVILEILAAMPDDARGEKGKAREAGSKTRVRIEVMAWTGLAHSQLAKLQPSDIDFATMTYQRPRRSKGRRGARNRAVSSERPVPLLPPAAEALRRFFALGASGAFSRSSVYKSWKRAIRAANAKRLELHRQAGAPGKPELIPDSLRPYDVKHTFGAEAYRAGKDLRAVQELLGLSRIELADRYAHAAVAPAAAEAAARLAERAEAAGKLPAADRKLPPKVTSRRKPKKIA